MAKRFLLYLNLLIVILCSCNLKKKNSTEHLDSTSLQKLAKSEFAINRTEIREKIIENNRLLNDSTILKDSILNAYYENETNPFLWINKEYNSSDIDSLIFWLENANKHGLNPEIFMASTTKDYLQRLRSLKINKEDNINAMLANVERNLTKSYLDYVCFINFGLITPQDILNKLEDEEGKGGRAPEKLPDGTTKKKKLYNIPLKKYDQEFVQIALNAINDDLPSFLRSIQPKDKYYTSIQDEYLRIDSLEKVEFNKIPEIGVALLKEGDKHAVVPLIARRLIVTGELPAVENPDSIYESLTPELLEAVNAFRIKNHIAKENSIGSYTIRMLNRPMKYYKDCLRINLERLRWKSQLEKGDKYVMVNVAAFMLQAIDMNADSILEMRVCCGTVKDKTPLLSSSINHIDLNPYWNVPKSIIRKEMVPAYRRDSNYFAKNRLRIYDREGNELNPNDIQWSKYSGDVPFDIKQDNKEGNSLGRLIFRFPNAFAVYLHDTPSRWSFMKNNRAVSHGCVRIEQPLNFAFFLLKDKDELLKDRIRVAIDLPAKSEEGKKLTSKKNYQEMKQHILKERVPVFLDYYTMYLSKDGELTYCEDTYKYDEPLLVALDKLNSIKE